MNPVDIKNNLDHSLAEVKEWSCSEKNGLYALGVGTLLVAAGLGWLYHKNYFSNQASASMQEEKKRESSKAHRQANKILTEQKVSNRDAQNGTSDSCAVSPATPVVNKGLPNLQYTCWLNSALKFMATSTHYDLLLEADVKELTAFGMIEEIRLIPLLNLQSKLKEIIATLRNSISPEEVVELGLYKELVQAIADANLFQGGHARNPWKDQLDASEFIRSLMNAYCFPLPHHLERSTTAISTLQNYSKTMWIYREDAGKTQPGALKFLHQENFAELLLLENPDNLDTPLNFMNAFSAPSQVEVLPDACLNAGILINGPFIRERHLIHAPDTLVINFVRALPSDPTTISLRPIELETGARLQIPVYNPEAFLNSKENGFEAVLKEMAHYQVEAACVKYGDADRGHWVCFERLPCNSFVCHNDSKIVPITEDKAQEAFRQATFLRLRKIPSSQK